MSVYGSSHAVMSSAAATVTTARKKRHTSLTSECPFRLLTSYSSIPVPANISDGEISIQSANGAKYKSQGRARSEAERVALDHVSNKTSSPEKGEIGRRFISALQASMCFGALT